MTRSGARLRPDERIAELVAASRALLADVGYERFLPAEVARRCGVSEATVYRYFPTKRELLVRVAETWFHEILDALEPGMTRHEGTYERLRYVVRYAVEVVRREPTLTRYILNELRPDPAFRSTTIHQLNRRFTGVIMRVLTDGIAAGELHADINTTLIRDMIYGAVEHQTWAYLRGDGESPPEQVAASIVQILGSGILAGLVVRG